MVAVIFVPKHLIMFIVVHQTNTGHRALSCYNASNKQNKFAFNCWSCHAFNVLHQLQSFSALCFAIFADEVVLFVFVLQTNIFCFLLFFFTWNILKHLRYFVLYIRQWWSLETWSRSRDASRDPFFQVSVSKVSGLVSVSKDFGLGLELFVSRLCIGYFLWSFARRSSFEKRF